MSFADGLAGAVKTGLCNYLGSAEDAGSWIQSRFGVNPAGAVGGIRRQLCDSPDTPVYPPPFDGGQCQGVSYRVFYTYDVVQGNPCGTQTFGAFDRVKIGPIRGLRTASVGTECPCPGGGNGEVYLQSSDVNGGLVEELVASRGQDCISGARITNIVRVDGGPDDCGDPSPVQEPFPPDGVPIPIIINYTDNSDNSVTTNANLQIFAPIFAPVGIVNAPIFAPVRIDLPDVTFTGNVQISPTFNLNVTPAGGDKSPGTGPEPTEPEPPDSEPGTPEDESNRRLIGVFVRSRAVGRTTETEIAQAFVPDLYVPRLANAYFRVRNGSTLGWLGPIDVKTTSCWVPVPSNTFAVLGRVDFEPGWGGEVTQVFSDADFRS